MILRIIYTLFIGFLLAAFVGVGIAAFYKGPTQPQMPATLKYCSPDITKDASHFADYTKQANTFDAQMQTFQERSQVYNRNVSIVAVIASVLILVFSLTLLRHIYLIADGLLLGGVFTLVYSIIRGFNSEDTMFRFFVVSVGLIVSLVLGYIKFIQPNEKARR